MDTADDSDAAGAHAAGVDWKLEVALAVRLRCDRRRAIEELRDRERDAMLSDAGRPGENQARRKGIPMNGFREQPNQPPVADDVSKRHDTAPETHRITSAFGLRLG
jgi:hypothetical protein